MRTGGASQFGLTQQTLPTLRAMDEDEMDAGIDVSEAGSNQPSPPLVIAPTRPHKQLARSHAVLTRTASKPEHGSKQGSRVYLYVGFVSIARAGACHVDVLCCRGRSQ